MKEENELYQFGFLVGMLGIEVLLICKIIFMIIEVYI